MAEQYAPVIIADNYEHDIFIEYRDIQRYSGGGSTDPCSLCGPGTGSGAIVWCVAHDRGTP